MESYGSRPVKPTELFLSANHFGHPRTAFTLFLLALGWYKALEVAEHSRRGVDTTSSSFSSGFKVTANSHTRVLCHEIQVSFSIPRKETVNS